MADDWKKKLRYRGLRLLVWSLPILILSLLVTSLIPRRPPLVLAAGSVTQVQPGTGRVLLPGAIEGPIPVLLELQWPLRPPPDLTLELLIRDPEDQNRLQKKIPIKANIAPGKVWQQTLQLALTPSPVQNYRLSVAGPASAKAVRTQYRLIAFAGMPFAKVLRVGEMLLYPALVFCLLAFCMILFPRFMS